jgi:GNAT superfamily N-acetyltransferase
MQQTEERGLSERSITGSVAWEPPTSLKFRFGKASDARPIAALWQQVHEVETKHPSGLPLEDILDTVSARLADPCGWFLLAFDGDAIVGMLYATIVTRITGLRRESSRQMHLSMLAIDSRHWKGGLGRTLVARALELGRERKVEAVRLWTDGNSAMSRIYQRLGLNFDHSWKLDADRDAGYRYVVDR